MIDFYELTIAIEANGETLDKSTRLPQVIKTVGEERHEDYYIENDGYKEYLGATFDFAANELEQAQAAAQALATLPFPVQWSIFAWQDDYAVEHSCSEKPA